MTARILVVDDIIANVKLLEARLTSEYFDVTTANSGPQALEICQKTPIDVILLDVMMPGMDGFEVCRKLKSDPRTQYIPVIMITALDQASDKIRGLEAGADDFLTKPVDDIALITRVKNLSRLKTVTDELIARLVNQNQIQGDVFLESLREAKNNAEPCQILTIDDHPRSACRIAEALPDYAMEIESDAQAALFKLTEVNYDLLILSLSLKNSDGLRICSQIRSMERTRHLPILTITDPGDEARLLRALDMGVNDYLVRPIDTHELVARVQTQLKRKRYTDFLQNQFDERAELAIVDPLTGLYNRRFMDGNLKNLMDEALRSGKPLTVLVSDIDYFKSVNDSHGHQIGDLVLKQFSKRIRQNTRGIDLAIRFGGEEFVIIMPETSMDQALVVAERLRNRIATEPFRVSEDLSIAITTSIGLGSFEDIHDTSEKILARADQALYQAKRNGRNQVVTQFLESGMPQSQNAAAEYA